MPAAIISGTTPRNLSVEQRGGSPVVGATDTADAPFVPSASNPSFPTAATPGTGGAGTGRYEGGPGGDLEQISNVDLNNALTSSSGFVAQPNELQLVANSNPNVLFAATLAGPDTASLTYAAGTPVDVLGNPVSGSSSLPPIPTPTTFTFPSSSGGADPNSLLQSFLDQLGAGDDSGGSSSGGGDGGGGSSDPGALPTTLPGSTVSSSSGGSPIALIGLGLAAIGGLWWYTHRKKGAPASGSTPSGANTAPGSHESEPKE